MTDVTNRELGQLIRESGWTLGQVAREVNRLGTERGTPTRYQSPSVHQWLRGGKPREDVRPLILEAFSRRLGRPVTHSEAGFSAPIGPGTSGIPRTVEELLDLGRQDMDPSRRSVVSAALYSVALSIPGWQDVVGRMNAFAENPRIKVGTGEVQTVKAMTDRLSDLDGEFGGRYARPMAAAFLVNTVAPYLKADCSDEVRRSMTSAAALLCYLTGWMAVDEGLHGSAQRYYIKSLEIAGAGGDQMTYRHVLRGMSVQAAELGHGAPSLRLASSAWDATAESTPRTRAFFTGPLAHAYALAGERSNALSTLRETERAVSQAESSAGRFGGFTSSTLAYATSQVRHALGDTKGSVESLKDHFRLRDSGDSQRSALRFGLLLGERQLEIGHLEEACETWDKALDGYPRMNSGRVDRQVGSIEVLTRPYAGNALVRQLRDRVHEVKTEQ